MKLLISAIIMQICISYELYNFYLKFLDFFRYNDNCSLNYSSLQFCLNPWNFKFEVRTLFNKVFTHHPDSEEDMNTSKYIVQILIPFIDFRV